MTFINSSGINGETSSVTSFLNSARNSGSLNTLRIASCRISTRSLGIPGGKTRGDRRSEAAPHRQELLFFFGFGKTLDLRELGEAWVRMLIALRDFQDRVKSIIPFSTHSGLRLKTAASHIVRSRISSAIAEKRCRPGHPGASGKLSQQQTMQLILS